MNSKTITLCNHKNPLLPNSISLSTLNHEHISLPFPPKRRRPRHSTQFRVSSDGFSCNRLSRSLRLASNRFFSRIQESVQTETGFDFNAAASGFAQRAKEAEDDFKRFFGLEFLSLKHWKWDDPNLIPANVTVEFSELFTRELTREVDEIMKGLSPAMFEDFVKPFQINSNERNMEVKISPSINTFHLPRVTPRFTFPFNRRIKKVVVKTKAMREWQEYEDALKRKDLATALSFLIKNNKNYDVAVVDKVNDDVNRVGDFGLGFKGWKSDRDWDVLDTCLNADDMRLVAKAYSFLCNRGFLPNFGKFTNIVLEGPREVTPKVLQSSTGLEVTKFAPKKWGLSGVSNFVLAAFLAGASYLTWQGVDVRPNLAAILGLAFVDSIFLGGTCLAQISSYWPPYRRRILVHEAGHLLVAYLMGCPIRGVILDPIVAMQMGIQGQAGTQFWDEKLNNELAEGRLTSTTFDRYCMVLFAGIAAEALVYGVAEGGENDENLFRSISVLLRPPLSVNQMSNQARWSVLQSYNLLKWHRHAHRAAFKALENGSSLSVVIRKIEEAMSSSE